METPSERPHLGDLGGEGPEKATRGGGGGEWEPIKILF
jgi:hypothetical protein